MVTIGSHQDRLAIYLIIGQARFAIDDLKKLQQKARC